MNDSPDGAFIRPSIAELTLLNSDTQTFSGFDVNSRDPGGATLKIFGGSFSTIGTDATKDFGRVRQPANFETSNTVLNTKLVMDGTWDVYDDTKLNGRLDGLGNIRLNQSGGFLELGYGQLDGVAQDISGIGGLKVTNGHVVLDGNNSFTGGLYIEDGATVEVSRPANTGGLANTIHFNGGQLTIDGSEGQYQYYTEKWDVESDSTTGLSTTGCCKLKDWQSPKYRRLPKPASKHRGFRAKARFASLRSYSAPNAIWRSANLPKHPQQIGRFSNSTKRVKRMVLSSSQVL